MFYINLREYINQMKMFPFCKENNYENRCWEIYKDDEKCLENHRHRTKAKE